MIQGTARNKFILCIQYLKKPFINTKQHEKKDTEGHLIFMDWKKCVKDSKTPQFDLHIQRTHYQNPAVITAKTDKMILKFIWKCKRHRTVKTILKNKRARELTLLNFKTSYQATVIKTV